jgi:hypothetical protein
MRRLTRGNLVSKNHVLSIQIKMKRRPTTRCVPRIVRDDRERRASICRQAVMNHNLSFPVSKPRMIALDYRKHPVPAEAALKAA